MEKKSGNVLVGRVWRTSLEENPQLFEFVCVVLQGCEGLVAVWLLLLRSTHLHRHLLHADDHRDAQPQERQPADCSQRAP